MKQIKNTPLQTLWTKFEEMNNTVLNSTTL